MYADIGSVYTDNISGVYGYRVKLQQPTGGDGGSGVSQPVVAAQVGSESKVRKRFHIIQLQALVSGAVKQGSTRGQAGVNLGVDQGVNHVVNQGSTRGQSKVNQG